MNNDTPQTQYVFVSNPTPHSQDIEMKCCNISECSFTPSISSNNTSTSYEIPSQRSTASSQYPQHTAHSSMECDDIKNDIDKHSHDITSTMIKNGFTPICETAKTLQGSIWKVYYNKLECEAIIKVTDKLLSQKRIGLSQRSGLYFPCQESIKQEINIIHLLNHNATTTPAMIGLYKVFEDNFYTFVAMEYGGTDLLSFINKCHDALKHKTMLVDDWHNVTKIMSKQMIEFIHWLHTDNNVCHLDLSLENILINNIEWEYDPKHNIDRLLPTFKLKFIDFGLAEIFTERVERTEDLEEEEDDDDDDDEYELSDDEEYESADDEDMERISFECNKFVGKLKYECPQIYNRETFDARCADIWSFGVCWFMICVGYNPWSVPDGKKDNSYDLMVNQQRLKDVLSHWKRSDYMDDDAHDLFYRIFADHMYRADTEEILQHSWLKM